MNNKAQVHPLIIIAAIVIILIIAGVITVPNFFQKKYQYLTELQTYPKNVSAYQNVEISLSAFNPQDYSFQARLSIEFDKILWTTDNYYLKRGESIDLGVISPNEIKKYSVQLSPTYEFNRNPTSSSFKIRLYDINNNLIEEREGVINAQK